MNFFTRSSKNEYENFSFEENDLFDRKKFGKTLENAINNLGGNGFVMSLNAEWGEGKSSFLYMWKKELEENNFKVIYFDAFKNDYVGNPIIPFTAEIINAFVSDKNKKADTFKKIAKNILPILSKIGTKLLLGNSDNQFIADSDLEKSIEDDISNFIEKSLENYIEEKKSVDLLRNTIEEVSCSSIKPLVFIIDELDRCKPDFALQVIEKIKHFFSVKNIVFVLSMNKTQCENFIQHIYGISQENAELYLQKFIDIEVQLPKNKDSEKVFENTTTKYIEKKFNNDLFAKFNTNNQGYSGYIKDVLIELTREKQLSLRDIEKIINIIGFYITTLPQSGGTRDSYKSTFLISLLAVVKIKNKNLYDKLRNKKATKKEVLNFLEIKDDDEKIEWITKNLSYFLDDEISEEIQSEFNRFTFDFYRSRRDIIPGYIQSIESFEFRND